MMGVVVALGLASPQAPRASKVGQCQGKGCGSALSGPRTRRPGREFPSTLPLPCHWGA